MSSLFEKIGGKDAIQAAVEVFYKKFLADERINSFKVSCFTVFKVIQKKKSSLLPINFVLLNPKLSILWSLSGLLGFL